MTVSTIPVAVAVMLLVDGRQGWRRQGGGGNVVDTDDGEVTGNGDSELPGSGKDRQCDLVVERADPGDGGGEGPPLRDGSGCPVNGQRDRPHLR